jgi:hypothetical protein
MGNQIIKNHQMFNKFQWFKRKSLYIRNQRKYLPTQKTNIGQIQIAHLKNMFST